MAEEEQKLRSADSAAPAGGSQREGAAGGAAVRTVRHAGAKTFVLKRGVWIDTDFNPETMTTERIGFGSEAYFDLLAARPTWGDYLALGERVIFVVDGAGGPTPYEVVAEGEGTAVVPPATEAPGTAVPGTEVPASPASTGEGPDEGDELEPVEPTATPGGERPPRQSSGLCPGAMAMAAVALAAAVVWQTWRQ
jgi:Ca-activated chloride channel family protein